jgi:hypothetical protein
MISRRVFAQFAALVSMTGAAAAKHVLPEAPAQVPMPPVKPTLGSRDHSYYEGDVKNDWYYGINRPHAMFGTEGDVYIDRDHNYWIKVDGKWLARGGLISDPVIKQGGYYR